ncbi:MAG: thiamine ABC transporter substrate-binding protein, partial [Treponema sp.]|nr:thiamine ABC transporter substrate-binding protein [Treponema sp.]
KAREADVLESYKPNKADSIINENIISSLGDDWILTPYDFSTFAIIYDTQSSVSAPKSLSDLTKKDYEKKLIIMDPRLSTPGLGFASWTLAVFGNEYESFWKNLKASILSMSPNWSSGYGLFTKGEAPLVISYTTSPAYHKYEDNSERYRTLSFYDGHIMQVEGAGITKGAKNIVGAKAFLDFLISEDAQEEIPIGQWMYPANKNIVLPDCYSVSNLENVKLLSYNIDELDSAIENIIRIISE